MPSEPLPVPRLPRPTQTVLPLLSARCVRIWKQWLAACRLFFCILILMFGVGSGIENANKLMMPVFFILFVFLGIYVAFQPGAMQGYRYIFRIDPEILADPKTWIFALGQAFFSLSVAGNGTLIYGSYLSDEENIPHPPRGLPV